MECINAKQAIKDTSKEIRHLSYTEKKSFNEQVNDFLDKVNEVKSFLKEKTSQTQEINHKLEGLTWFTGLDEECMEIIYGIILMAKDLHSSLNKYYTKFDRIRIAGIAKVELKEFKAAINDLKEIYTDVESIFFELPFDKGFQETSKKLASL